MYLWHLYGFYINFYLFFFPHYESTFHCICPLMLTFKFGLQFPTLLFISLLSACCSFEVKMMQVSIREIQQMTRNGFWISTFPQDVLFSGELFLVLLLSESSFVYTASIYHLWDKIIKSLPGSFVGYLLFFSSSHLKEEPCELLKVVQFALGYESFQTFRSH